MSITRSKGLRGVVAGLLALVLALIIAPAIARADDVTPLDKGGELASGSYQLSADVTETITVPEGATVSVDLNGHSVKPAAGDALVNKGTLAVTGEGEVAASAKGSASLANFPDATATLSGGTYSSATWYVIKNLGTLTIDGAVTVQGTDGNVSSLIDNGWYAGTDTVAGEKVAAQAGKASLTIEDGTFSGKSGNASCSVLKNDDYGVAVVNGGTFDSTANTNDQNSVTILNWNELTINGGTFTGKFNIASGSYGADTADKGVTVINGGTFSASSESNLGYANGTAVGSLTINGGSFDKIVSDAYTNGNYSIAITGGTFANDVSAYVPADSGLIVVRYADGSTSVRDQIRFVDVTDETDHDDDINALADLGVTEGWTRDDGEHEYRPYNKIARADVAAFLYRLAGSPAYTAPEESPFTDVSSTETAHYKEICWLASTGISKGWDNGDGTVSFHPYDNIARADMAAFLHRFVGVVWPDLSTASDSDAAGFVDVSTDVAHRDDILWLQANKVSEGFKAEDGTAEYRPYESIARCDMAAFLVRLNDLNGLG